MPGHPASRRESSQLRLRTSRVSHSPIRMGPIVHDCRPSLSARSSDHLAESRHPRARHPVITIRPIRRALVPVDAPAAARVSAPNYDEFQSDEEVRALIRRAPESVLRVTMPHCDPGAEEEVAADSPAALARAATNMRTLIGSDSVRIAHDLLYIYRIGDPNRPGIDQIGLGGMARIDEIRTEATRAAPIIRNEGVREPKARGRARLIEATSSFIGTVNCAVPDASGAFAHALEQLASDRAPDHGADDDRGCRHDVWLIGDPSVQARLIALAAAEPEAYVADGNHRSAAAAMLDREHFLCVFFPLARMSLAPYNRLVRDFGMEDESVLAALRERFAIEEVPRAHQPARTHRIGLYNGRAWYRLRPLPGSYDERNAVECIDADIVQRNFFDAVLGIGEPGDHRLNFVGGDRDLDFLQAGVDSGAYRYAVTLAPVTLGQFAAVCRQNRIMPPKSTWFQPKIRSGLVMALDEEPAAAR